MGGLQVMRKIWTLYADFGVGEEDEMEREK